MSNIFFRVKVRTLSQQSISMSFLFRKSAKIYENRKRIRLKPLNLKAIEML